MKHGVIARDGTDDDAMARREAARPEHLRRIAPRVERGEILVGEAILDEAGGMVGSVLLVDFETRGELDAWLEADPYVTGGVWRDIEVQPYRPAVGAAPSRVTCESDRIARISTVTTATTGFDEHALRALPATAPFVETIRAQALAEFEALPVPSQETEEWRYTDLEDFGFDLRPFAEGGGPEAVDEHGVLQAAGVAGERAGLQIQRNSEVISTRLADDLAGKGVIFGDLDRAIADHPELVEPYLHSLVATGRSKFTALHAAFRTGGTFLYVPAGVAIALPLQTLTWIDAEDSAVFPRTLLVAGEDAEVTFVDRYASPALGRALSDAIVEIHAGPNSRVRYIALQEYGEGVTHLAVQRARVARGASLKTLGVAFGASLARAEVEALLAEDGASSEMLGVYFGDADQHIDHRSIQDHVGSRTSSDLLYKGAMRDSSNAIYTGTVVIEKGAHHCNAYQTNRNILLSEHARAHSVPNLEILTNDPTRCGHAASVGPVSDDELFYLMSRGIPEQEAERLIVFGFFAEVLDRVDIAEIREGLERAIEDEIARGFGGGAEQQASEAPEQAGGGSTR